MSLPETPAEPAGRGVSGSGDVPDRGLSGEQRLARPGSFREAFDQGPGVAGRFMVMWLRRGEGASLRLGVVASRRSFRRSVDRSRARRLLREAYRLNRHRLEGPVDVVLVARSRILGVKTHQVAEDLVGLARKANILKA